MSAIVASPPSTPLPGMSILRALGRTLLALLRQPAGAIGLVGVVFFLFMAFVGPSFVTLDVKTKFGKEYQLPSSEFLLGTDYQGRDVFSQIVHGGREIIIVATTTALITTAIAVSLGALAGFLGGWFDTVVLAIADIILTIPQFPLLLVLATFVRLNNIVLLGVLLAALGWPALMRAIRSQVLSLRQRDYIEAARCLDLGTGHIVFRQILPSMTGYIAISFTLGMINAIFLQVGLIFLGLVPLSGNNWGVMLQLAWVRGAIFIKGGLGYILSPVVAISLLQLSLIMLARSLEEIFNPRLSRGN